MKILMYSTGELFKNGQTGGIKRFIELARYLQKEFGADLCCADDDVVLKKNGLRSTYQMRPIKAEMYRFFPPEGRIAITNRDIIKRIKKFILFIIQNNEIIFQNKKRLNWYLK